MRARDGWGTRWWRAGWCGAGAEGQGPCCSPPRPPAHPPLRPHNTKPISPPARAAPRRPCSHQTHGGAIFQESADGRFLGIITAPDQLDALLRALNPRGPREAALLAVLRRRQDELAAELRPPDHPLDVTKVRCLSGGEGQH